MPAAATSSNGKRNERGWQAAVQYRASELRMELAEVIMCEPEHPSQEEFATRKGRGKGKGHKQQTITSHPIPSPPITPQIFKPPSHIPIPRSPDPITRDVKSLVIPNPTLPTFKTPQMKTSSPSAKTCSFSMSRRKKGQLYPRGTDRSSGIPRAIFAESHARISPAPQNMCKLQLGNCSSPSINLLEVFHPSFGSEDLN
ncbi:hypothetical protein EAE99_009318 [Botrytis elliptica]|nr:hypothetical protein EAE99_009318 [Botrytis elliptica]